MSFNLSPVSPLDSWSWMVILLLIFTGVIRKQFLVCKLHAGNVTEWNMSCLDSWISNLPQSCLKYTELQAVQRYSTDMRYVNISIDHTTYLLMFWYVMIFSLTFSLKTCLESVVYTDLMSHRRKYSAEYLWIPVVDMGMVCEKKLLTVMLFLKKLLISSNRKDNKS